MRISVVICTHNPRMDYLYRTLDGLRGQSLPTSEWELVIVDNKSNDPLTRRVDLSWHKVSRVVREQNLGLTPARLRGIQETIGDIVVFVDDDNILAESYLSNVLRIHREHPFL
ncbi:MAG: glycosyltransferase family 2 protein, partial [Verrucomicrobiota bacterium]